MVMYGPTPSAADLKHNEEARHRPVPRPDGTDPEPYWNCTRNGTIFKVRCGTYDPYGQFFSIIHSIENQIVEHALRNLVPRGTGVIDAGAAFGSFTLPFLVTGHPTYSFEVEEPAFHELMGHIRLNKNLITPEHINCYNIGLWNDGVMGDFYNMKNITFRKLDKVLPDVNNISFFKCDVEGAELEVMQGGADLLIRNQPNMWIECHEIFKPGVLQQVLAFIKELGFKGFTIKEFDMVQGCKHLLVTK